MELISVASLGNVMMTNAAVSPNGRLFGNSTAAEGGSAAVRPSRDSGLFL